MPNLMYWSVRGLLWIAFGLPLMGCAQSPTGPKGDPWRFLPGTVVSFSYAAFRDGRQCWIYLPPSYAHSDRRFPVLYLNDGEIAFDAEYGMHVGRICEDLIRRGEIEPIIVVAIENAPDQRTYDYTPWPASYWKPNGGGDFYLRAIRDTLKPEVDRRFRTLPDPGNTAMAGTSLGGLISAYAGYAFDSTFGRVAALSPSYGYAAFAMPAYAITRGRPALLQRFYQDTGFPDDNWIGWMEQIALEQGFILGVDFVSVTVEGGEHSTASWENRVPNMLRFLFPPMRADRTSNNRQQTPVSVKGYQSATNGG